MARSRQCMEFLGDVITSAVEGGTGYWAQVSQYQYTIDGSVCVCVGKRDGREPRAILHELKENDPDPGTYEEAGHVVTPDVVWLGIKRVISDECKTRADLRETIRDAARELDAGMIDAEAADVIVQAALFGEVRYG